MGTWKKLASFRLDEPHLDLLREVGAMCDPPSENLSFNLRVLLNGFWAFLITGRMPRWMAEMQGKHRIAVSDSVGQSSLLPSPKSEADAGTEGRSRIGLGLGAEAAKRPPVTVETAAFGALAVLATLQGEVSRAVTEASR